MSPIREMLHGSLINGRIMSTFYSVLVPCALGETSIDAGEDQRDAAKRSSRVNWIRHRHDLPRARVWLADVMGDAAMAMARWQVVVHLHRLHVRSGRRGVSHVHADR